MCFPMIVASQEEFLRITLWAPEKRGKRERGEGEIEREAHVSLHGSEDYVSTSLHHGVSISLQEGVAQPLHGGSFVALQESRNPAHHIIISHSLKSSCRLTWQHRQWCH